MVDLKVILLVIGEKQRTIGVMSRVGRFANLFIIRCLKLPLIAKAEIFTFSITRLLTLALGLY